MPRTKISKTTKRNREAAHREEKIRDYESSVDSGLIAIDTKGMEFVSDLENAMKMLIDRTSRQLLKMKFGDFMALNLKSFNDYSENTSSLENINASKSMCNSATQMRTLKVPSMNDEEDSTRSSYLGTGALTAYLSVPRNTLQQQNSQRGRTPGPLSSARARKPRRSRSACNMQGSAIKPKLSAMSDHASRSKMRTPIASRSKALSADRTVNSYQSPKSPPTAFMRWPKPGEMVLSVCGSPVVAQVMPDKFANVNIPVKNGVLSLRPKKLNELKPDIVEAIDPETLDQIKTLHANLNVIMNMANKAMK
ncbi:borealin-like isoform X2 [Teleopsis dalmanni]|uniref:borealin-like isoform X2 n=1 Tax=Teleopsis dalmanni TaxID=139649 RepID=UPI0018CCF31C|nr:borealin-like isoform X2 [Teleopsis dalmanni]